MMLVGTDIHWKTCLVHSLFEEMKYFLATADRVQSDISVLLSVCMMMIVLIRIMVRITFLLSDISRPRKMLMVLHLNGNGNENQL